MSSISVSTGSAPDLIAKREKSALDPEIVDHVTRNLAHRFRRLLGWNEQVGEIQAALRIRSRCGSARPRNDALLHVRSAREYGPEHLEIRVEMLEPGRLRPRRINHAGVRQRDAPCKRVAGGGFELNLAVNPFREVWAR